MIRHNVLVSTAALLFGTACAETVAPPRMEATTGIDWKVDCSRSPAMPARQAGAPVDDFAGLRMGLSMEDAATMAVCIERVRSPADRADARIVASVNGLRPFDYLGQSVRTAAVLGVGTFVPRNQMPRLPSTDSGEASVTQYFRGTLVTWGFHSFGLPGQERIYGFTRNERYADDVGPDLEQVRSQVIQKYGAPHRVEEGVGAVDMWWVYDATGKPTPLPRSGVPCPAPVYVGESMQAGPDGACNIAIRVRIAKQRNVYKAAGLYLGIVHANAMGQAVAQSQDGIRQIARSRAGAPVKGF